jgi:enoyl-CoA hydratase/carnithine racemase
VQQGRLEVERRGNVALLTLRNEARRNAVTPRMLAELAAALPRLAAEGVRAAVLTGAGQSAFSAGFDLGALEDVVRSASDGGAAPIHPLAPAVEALATGPLPVVAALNGVAIGGGCELAVACELRVAHPRVTLRMPPVKLGLVYSAEGMRRFAGLIGLGRTRELFLLAEPIDAERALGWGLVSRIVDEAAVVDTALQLAERLAEGAPLAVAGTRRTLELLLPPLGPDAQAELEALCRRSFASADAEEARRAFRERRPPRFTGA